MHTEDPNATWHFLPTYKPSLIERVIDSASVTIILALMLSFFTFITAFIYAAEVQSAEMHNRHAYEATLSALSK